MARKTFEEKNLGTYVARLASTFSMFFVFSVVQILLQIALRAMQAPGHGTSGRWLTHPAIESNCNPRLIDRFRESRGRGGLQSG